jgi:outer membrane protein TolC
VAVKLAAAEQARAQREEMLRAHVGELRALLAEWQSGRERLAGYQRDLIPLSEERSRAALAAYQGGRAGLADLLLARRGETEVRMQAVQLEMETARAWAQLNFLTPHAGATP